MVGRTGDHFSESEVDDDGAKRSSAADGAGCERERVVSFSTCDTCLFGEAELVGRRDARAGIFSSMGDGLMTARGIPPPFWFGHKCILFVGRGKASRKCGRCGDFSESCNDA